MFQQWTVGDRDEQIGISIFGRFLSILFIELSGQNILQRTLKYSIIANSLLIFTVTMIKPKILILKIDDDLLNFAFGEEVIIKRDEIDELLIFACNLHDDAFMKFLVILVNFFVDFDYVGES